MDNKSLTGIEAVFLSSLGNVTEDSMVVEECRLNFDNADVAEQTELQTAAQ